MNILITIFMFIVFSSTYGQIKNEKLNIITTEPISTNAKIPKTWKNSNSIQKEWIKVEKDEKGFLIYDPCDGNTPTIKFDNEFINIKSNIETEKFKFKKLSIVSEGKSFRLDAYNSETKTWFEIKTKIIDNKKGIVLWEFSNVKWLMTPIENIEKFRIITNNCLKAKRKELKFLPVNESID